MNVKWADVKEDYARKDAEIEALKVENKKLKFMIEYGLGFEDMVNDINVHEMQNNQ